MFKYTKNGIELVYIDSYKYYCYPILTDFIIDYKEQIFIMGIKINMQDFICYNLIKKKVNNLILRAIDPPNNLKSTLKIMQ